MITGRITLDINDRDVKLSFRESQCFYLIVRGKTPKEIAGILGLNTRTVESYIDRIKCKTNTPYKSAFIELAIKNNLITLNFKDL